MRATESFSVLNQAAGTYPVIMGNQGGGINSGRNWIIGGRYMMALSGTTPVAHLKMLGPDNTTYLTIFGSFNNAGTEADLEIGGLSAAGAKAVDLPGGVYEVVLTGSALYFSLTRVPVSD